MSGKMKIINMSLATALALGSLSACSSTKDKGTEFSGDTTENLTKEPYEISLAIPVTGAVDKDIPLIQEEINKITKAKINTTVKFNPISTGAWQQTMNLMSASGEKLDMLFVFGQSYGANADTGKIIELDTLLNQYGQDLKKQFDPEFLNSAKIKGKIYGVPVLKDFTTGVPGIFMRKDLLEKYKINAASINKLDDLDPVFKTIKDNEPNISPLGVGLSIPAEKYVWYDKLGDRFGVLPSYDNGLKIVNLFETKEYEDFLKKMHSWFKAGYINKDAATSKVGSADLMKAKKSFSYIESLKIGGVERGSRNAGFELTFVPLLPEVYSSTSDVLTGMWAISNNSENPERTMMFMNLMYTNNEIANLLKWGIEGKHYVKVKDNMIDYPPGIDSTTVGYSTPNWLTANPFRTYVFSNDPPDLWKLSADMNYKSIKSKALGFTFNSEPVKNEVTALNNVMDQYKKSLESGTIDPADKLQEFRDKLKSAGIDKVIAEKQKQLDAWAAANKK